MFLAYHFLFAISLFLFQSLNHLPLNCSPLSTSMRSWYSWLGISSWRQPTIQGTCMVLEEWSTRAVVMMMMTTVMRRKIRRRLLAINPRKGSTIDFLQFKIYRHTTQRSLFSFCFYYFYISFSRHFNFI